MASIPATRTNFTITRSWISDGDDNVAVGAAGTAPAANISVTNNRFFAGHGESIGSYTQAGVSNVLFDSNMLSGNGIAGAGSSVNNTADSNSTGLRIKSGYDRGGVVTNIQYSNSCFQDHKAEIVFSPNYEATTGSLAPNLENILMQNLAFLTAGTVQFTGTSDNGTIYPLQLTLDNVSFPSTFAASEFSPAPTETALSYGPGQVSSDFIADYATFVNANGNTVTNNITATSLNPPICSFTYIAPELTGPNGLPQTITEGQNATAVVILTPAVGGAAYPTGTVTLTDALTSRRHDSHAARNHRHVLHSAHRPRAGYAHLHGNLLRRLQLHADRRPNRLLNDCALCHHRQRRQPWRHHHHSVRRARFHLLRHLVHRHGNCHRQQSNWHC